jgi:hypothetical protein
MWFKTRSSLANVDVPTEILAAKDAKLGTWIIYASSPIGSRMTLKNFFGSERDRVAGYSTWLAAFYDVKGVTTDIAECMTHIEVAIRNKVDFCDLSQFGDAQAWPQKWHQIQWPRDNPI